MQQKSFLLTAFTLFFSFDTSIANERRNPSNEDIAITDKSDRILQLLETLYKYSKENEIAREISPPDDRWESSEPDPETTYDSSSSISKLMSDWLNREVIKRKRAHHRALCHFKICNMGSKRSGNWDV